MEDLDFVILPAWGISHNMRFSDKVAAVSAYTWGSISAPFARHVYSPIVDVVSGLAQLVSGGAKIAYRVREVFIKLTKRSELAVRVSGYAKKL